MAEDEVVMQGVTRRVSTANTTSFAPFVSLTGAATTLAAGLSRDEKSYNSVPMSSITLRTEGNEPDISFMLALDDLSFLNLVISSSVSQLVDAYNDGAVSNIQEPEDTARVLRGLIAHWNSLIPSLEAFANGLAPADEAKEG